MSFEGAILEKKFLLIMYFWEMSFLGSNFENVFLKGAILKMYDQVILQWASKFERALLKMYFLTDQFW